jgi:hypothetical protein
MAFQLLRRRHGFDLVSLRHATGTLNEHKDRFDAFATEISLARTYAGFHYRNSKDVGRDMGQKIGAYIHTNALQPS